MYKNIIVEKRLILYVTEPISFVLKLINLKMKFRNIK